MNLKESLDITKFSLKDNLSEISLAVITFVLSSYLISLFGDFISTKFLDFFLFKESYLPLGFTTIKIILWVFLFFISNDFLKFLKRGSEYTFSTTDWPKKWIFHGLDNIQINPSCLVIKHSESGCLLKSCFWKDFEMNFEIKYFPEVTKSIDRSFGILFRAVNLDSYYMVEFHYKSDIKKIFIKPHIRLNGHWEVLDDFELDRDIDVSDYFNIKFKVEDQKANVFICNNQVYEWILPTHIDRYGRIDDTSENDKHKFNSRSVPVLPFWRNYGMIGFRASWYQGAYIKNLKITTLSKLDKVTFFFKK